MPNTDVIKLIDKLSNIHLELVKFTLLDFRHKTPYEQQIKSYEELLEEQTRLKNELECQGYKFDFEQCLAVIPK